MKKRTVQGFTLLEVMVVASLMGGLALTSLKIQELNQKTTSKAFQDLEVIQTLSDIGGTISMSSQCDDLIQNGLSEPLGGKTVKVELKQIGSYLSGSTLSSRLSLNSLNLVVDDPETSPNRAALVINFLRPEGSSGVKEFSRRIPMQLRRDVNGNAVGCVAEKENAMSAICEMVGGNFDEANSFCDSFSLNRNIAGSSNIAVGSGSILAAVSGTHNIGIGQSVFSALTSGEGNIGIGRNIGVFSTTGSFNVGLGVDALQGIGSGGQNTAVGSFSGQKITTGSNNIALGANALTGSGNLTGSFNTAIGSNSLARATSGSRNIAVGGESPLRLLTTGSNNIALGDYAGELVTTGVGNIIMGKDSARALTTGSYNISIGENAGRNFQTNSTAIAIGYRSQETSTAGSNISIGSGALRGVLNSYDNIGIGYDAGVFLTTGEGNILLGGGLAGSYAPVGAKISTGNNNTVVGKGALSNGGVAPTAGQGSVSESTIIGANAGRVAGDRITAIGTESMENHSGANNIAIGYRALRIGSGTYNTVIGNEAFDNVSSSSAQRNIIIGDRAAGTTSGGSYNVIMGEGAATAVALLGSGNTILGNTAVPFGGGGDNNVIIGRDAGGTNNGSRNVLLGYRAGTGSLANFPVAMSDTLVIANASNGRLITGDFSSNKVAINALPSAAPENFYVAGSARVETNLIVNSYAVIGGSARMTNNMLTVNGRTYIGSDLSVSGAAAKIGGGAWGNFSDKRMKNIRGHYTYGIKDLLKINVLNFSYKKNKLIKNINTEKIYPGIIAQEIQKIIPESVYVDKNSGYLVFDSSYMTWTLVNAVKEQQEMIKDLQMKNASLEERLLRIEKSLNIKEEE
jgi:trimeric autotransporter adhesin